MERLPKDLNPKDLARFTKHHWENLDETWGFWSERWRRVVEFIRSQHWRVLREANLEQIPRWRRFPSLGYTLSVYSDQIAQFLQSQVRYSAVPASSDPNDIAAANLAESILRHAWSVMEIERKKLDLAAWLAATGNAAFRSIWNLDDGDLLPVEGQPDQFQLSGELGADVLSPQLVRYPTSEKDGVMVGMLLTEDEASGMYGEEVVNKLRFSRQGTMLISNLTAIQSPGLHIGSEDLHRATVIEHYIPRSRTFPMGLWWTASEDMILTQPQPLPGGIIPITQFRWVPLPGSRIGITPLYDISFSNKMADEMLGKAVEWGNKVVPKALLMEGGGIESSQMTDEPFQPLTVVSGGEPKFPDIPGIPDHLFQLIDRSLSDIQFQAGYAFQRPDEPRAGTTPGPRVPVNPKRQSSGSQVSLLELNSKPAWEHLGKVTLAYVKQFYDAGRTFSLIGQDRLFEWIEFSSEELQRLPNAIQVDEVPLYTSNRQTVRDTVISLMGTPAAQILFSDIDESGQFVPDKDRIETAMQSIGVNVGIAELDPDIAEARNEHAFAKMGQTVEVGDWQNHAIHLSEHNKLRKSINYRSWPPQARALLEQNIQGHQQVLAQAQQAEQEGMIEFERQMRNVRETEAQQAEVKSELAKAIIDGVGEVIKQTLTGAMGGSSKENK